MPRWAALQGERHRQCAVHRPQLAAERELAGELEGRQAAGIDMPGRGEDAERDRQIEAARLLRQVGGREADRDPLVVRELETARLQRRPHPLARLLHFGVGQADEREARQAVGEVHLDRHRRRIEAAKGATVNDGKGHVYKGDGARREGKGPRADGAPGQCAAATA